MSLLSEQFGIGVLPNRVLETDSIIKLKTNLVSYQTYIGTRSLKNLEKMMYIYMKEAEDVVRNCYKKPVQAAAVAKILHRALMFFHTFHLDILVYEDHSGYYAVMIELLAMYMNMEIKAAKLERERTQKISSRIMTALYIFLNDSDEYILHAILKTRVLHKLGHEIFIPIFSKLLGNRDHPIVSSLLTEVDYYRYILCFKLWRMMLKSANDQQFLVKVAQLQLTPPESFFKCKELCAIIPVPLNNNEMQITGSLIEADVSISKAIEDYFKYIEDTEVSPRKLLQKQYEKYKDSLVDVITIDEEDEDSVIECLDSPGVVDLTSINLDDDDDETSSTNVQIIEHTDSCSQQGTDSVTLSDSGVTGDDELKHIVTRFFEVVQRTKTVNVDDTIKSKLFDLLKKRGESNEEEEQSEEIIEKAVETVDSVNVNINSAVIESKEINKEKTNPVKTNAESQRSSCMDVDQESLHQSDDETAQPMDERTEDALLNSDNEHDLHEVVPTASSLQATDVEQILCEQVDPTTPVLDETEKDQSLESAPIKNALKAIDNVPVESVSGENLNNLITESAFSATVFENFVRNANSGLETGKSQHFNGALAKPDNHSNETDSGVSLSPLTESTCQYYPNSLNNQNGLQLEECRPNGSKYLVGFESSKAVGTKISEVPDDDDITSPEVENWETTDFRDHYVKELENLVRYNEAHSVRLAQQKEVIQEPDSLVKEIEFVTEIKQTELPSSLVKVVYPGKDVSPMDRQDRLPYDDLSELSALGNRARRMGRSRSTVGKSKSTIDIKSSLKENGRVSDLYTARPASCPIDKHIAVTDRRVPINGESFSNLHVSRVGRPGRPPKLTARTRLNISSKDVWHPRLQPIVRVPKYELAFEKICEFRERFDVPFCNARPSLILSRKIYKKDNDGLPTFIERQVPGSSRRFTNEPVAEGGNRPTEEHDLNEHTGDREEDSSRRTRNTRATNSLDTDVSSELPQKQRKIKFADSVTVFPPKRIKSATEWKGILRSATKVTEEPLRDAPKVTEEPRRSAIKVTEDSLRNASSPNDEALSGYLRLEDD